MLHPQRDLPFGLFAADRGPDDLAHMISDGFERYKQTLRPDRRLLVDRYRIADWGIKVVGVGSAGTRCLIALLLGRQEGDPLFLQIKEATASVMEDHLGPSVYDNHGRRVVEGQRLMQAASDPFLGWTEGATGHYYWRQLRDMKGSPTVEMYAPTVMAAYARLCGWTLARAHARTGDPVAIAAYMGKGAVFDDAITVFAERYADQNEADYHRLLAAIESGRVNAAEEY